MKMLIKFELKQRKSIIFILMIILILSIFYLVQQNSFNNVSKQIVIMNNEKRLTDKEIGKYAENINTAIINNDNRLYLNNKINLDKYYLNNNFYSHSEFANTKQYYENRITFNQYLRDHKIKSMNKIDTPYNNLEEVNGVSAIYNIIVKLFPIMMPMVTLLTAYQIFKIKPDTYNYLMTLPNKKKEILISKWLAVFIINLVVLFFTVISAFVIGSLIGGIGDFDYPIITNYLNINSSSQTFISYKLYLLFTIIVSVLKIAIYTTIGMFLVNAIKNKWVALLVSIIMGIIPTIYIFSLDYTYYSNLIPFVFDGSHAIVTYSFSLFNIISYILVMIIVIYLGITISNNQFNKLEE